MLRNMSRRYMGGAADNQNQNNQNQNGQTVAAPSEKPGVATKRRALGDITNNFAREEPQEGSRKPQPFLEPVRPMETIEERVVTQVVDDRVYMQREADEIDARDNGNPILATAYVVEMYENFMSLEKKSMVNFAYMTNQPHVNERMRAILVDWLVEVHLKFKMVPETLYLCVTIIDRYLELKQVRRSRLQLVGITALLVAAKYEEIYPPEFRDLVYITDRAYTKQEILEMETDIVNTLQYNFTLPTIHTFLCRHLKAAHADRTMVQLACYLAERCLQEYSMVKFLPSVIAATVVMVARKSLRRHPWSPTLLEYTKYDESDLTQCAEEMKVYLSNTGNQQQAVQRKYSSQKFGGVAKLPLLL